MDRSKSRIFTFHSDDVSRTARVPGAEFVAVTGGYGRFTGGAGVSGLIYIFIPFIVKRKWNLFFFVT